MIIDLAVLAALGILTYLGYRKGFSRQIVGLAAIVAVYFLAPMLAGVVRNFVFSSEGITFPGVEVTSLIIAGIVVFVGVWLIGRTFVAAITTFSERIEDIDMTLGAILGFVKGTLFVYIVLCVLVYAEAPLATKMPPFGEQAKSSFTLAGARQYNVITRFKYPELGELRGALIAAQDPDKVERNEALGRLLEKQEFRSVVSDEKLVKAATDKDYSTLLSDERVIRLLADEDFRTVLTNTDWDGLIDE